MLDAVELLARMQQGELTSVELTEQCLAQIGSVDPQVKAFLSVDRAGALAQAAEIDRARQAGETVGPLAGLPVALKDIFCTTGTATTCSSKMLEKFVPPYDAEIVTRLKNAGAVLIGKTNMDEFAMGSSTENSAFQTTRNPWDLERAPGGSSGGSAAAVAAGMVPLSVGTDTGGSIRQPAAFCGIVGLKPTYGRVSRYGMIAFASSLDQAGPMTANVRSAALLLETLAGKDPRDSTCLDAPVPSYFQRVDQPLQGLKIGVVREHFHEKLNPEVAATVRRGIEFFRDRGAEIREISLPHSRFAVAVYYLIASSEASSNLSRFDGIRYGHRAAAFEDLGDLYATTRGEGFGAEVKRRVMLGAYALSAGYYDAYYLKALKVRRLIRDDFQKIFADVDFVISPVTPTPAFRLGEHVDDPLAMYLADLYTISANLAGLPAISLPAGLSEAGLPIGLQLIGPPLAEDHLLRAARMFEREIEARNIPVRPDRLASSPGIPF